MAIRRRVKWAHVLGFALVVVPLLGWIVQQDSDSCYPKRWKQCR